jgi:hypothetical protein
VQDYQIKTARGREVASSVVLPETADEFFDSAVKADESQRAALTDKATADLV